MRLKKLGLFLVALLTCLLGIGVSVAEIVDGFEAHVVCPEGGEVLHLAPSPEQHAQQGWHAGDVKVHVACALAEHGILPAPLLVSAPSIEVLDDLPVPALLAAAALDPPAASPLVNAPKTSPPARG